MSTQSIGENPVLFFNIKRLPNFVKNEIIVDVITIATII